MTEEERKQVYQALLARSKNGKLGKDDTKEVATQFGTVSGERRARAAASASGDVLDPWRASGGQQRRRL